MNRRTHHNQINGPQSMIILPSPGRHSIWTGRTTSGQTVDSIVPMTNRQVQIHFESPDSIEFRHTFDNSEFQKLANFLYEYPMRHFGIQTDDMDPSNIPNETPRFYTAGNFPITLEEHHGQPRTSRFQGKPVNHLRFSHAPTVGREFVVGCPKIGHALASKNLQAVAFHYTHHKSSDSLILKVCIDNANCDFRRDLRLGFPNFNFNKPVMFRDHFCMGDKSFITRKRIN